MVKDAERNITVSRSYQFTDSSDYVPYFYNRGGVVFEFEVATTYENRLIVDKSGKEHMLPRAIDTYIIEHNLRITINRAYRASGLDDLTDKQYADIKSDLCAAISILAPETDVSFIGSIADKRLLDNKRNPDGNGTIHL
jgi:hypothetical protein